MRVSPGDVKAGSASPVLSCVKMQTLLPSTALCTSSRVHAELKTWGTGQQQPLYLLDRTQGGHQRALALLKFPLGMVSEAACGRAGI